MYWLTIVGFFIAVLVVSLGGGGGMAYVGILVACFGIPPEIAASTSLATIIPTTLVGTISHIKQKNIRYNYLYMMIPGGIIGVVAGTFLMHGINPSVARKIFGIALILLTIPMFLSVFKINVKSKKKQSKYKHEDLLKSIIFGLMAGLMTGALGLSGTAPVILGLISLGCSALEVIGTSLAVIFVLSIAGFLTHLSVGSIDWKIIGWLLAGTIPGALVSPLLLKMIKKETLEKFATPLLIIIILASGILLLIK
ncbi:MAG: sulfite exporter TauE/SafE family protein [Bacteroidales bacterium]|jgi:uncharacterized membrane protein YfcA|nr:sulfite exporter TauE/SafE family protein [Bacteroidales bacterium]MCI2122328.1 sulfite exporter TauE/SafE family protein [Bacteroidales bacterium]MCI2145745.1 sulfite exporter TauE/SafE family protein [Bacteroidales bacterium]